MTPAFYERHSVVNRAPKIKKSGIKGVVIVHATDDPFALYSWSRQMFRRLGKVRVPAQLFSVNPANAYVGHGDEADRTHPVIRAGFDTLAALFNHRALPLCSRKFSVDAATEEITPDPSAVPCRPEP